MKKYPQIEETWIRRVRENNNMTKELQVERGLFNYKIEDILLICLEKNKTKNKFDKKQRNFEYLASFADYVNGNVKVNLLNKTFIASRSIVILIYFTKFCVHKFVSIPDNVFNVLGYKNLHI
jgi:hypothetical protein